MMVSTTTYSLTVTMVKVSVLLLYRRIFTTLTFKRVNSIAIGVCLAWLLIAVFNNIFLCHPVSAAFNHHLLFSNHCANLQSWYLGITISNLLLDLIVLSLPLFIIRTLKLSTKQKIMLSSIFLLGSLYASPANFPPFVD